MVSGVYRFQSDVPNLTLGVQMADGGGGIYREVKMCLTDLLNLRDKGRAKENLAPIWWYTALIPGLRRLRQEDHKFQANMGLRCEPCFQCMPVFMNRAQRGLHAIISFMHK